MENAYSNRELVKNYDIPLLVLTAIISLFGIIMVASAGGEVKYVVVQIAACILGFAAIGFLTVWDYEHLSQLSGYLYAISIILLILVLIPHIGYEANGARSWFRFGNLISVQPAEIVKIAFIITMATHINRVSDRINDIGCVGFLLLHIGTLVALILLQPDFGTAAVFLCIFISMMFFTNISYKYALTGAVCLGAAIPLAWKFVLKDYMKDRILSMLHPETDALGTGYQVIQSKIAVGSGKLFGYGLFGGASRFGSLPERHTDFIFSVICEELGIVGGLVAIALLVAIIVRCIIISQRARDNVGKYICIGVAAMFLFQGFENIGMCIGIMPVTGITLPFFSYGGSSLLTNLIAIGLVESVHCRSRAINF